MRSLRRCHRVAALLLLFVAANVSATVTIKVTTASDEYNCYVNGSSPTFACDVSGNPTPPPLSTGCSLREAISVVDAGNNNAYPECTPAPETGSSADNIIDINGFTIVLDKAVPDPNQPASTNTMIQNTSMPDIFGSSTIGKLTITDVAGGGAIQCASPGERMFHVVAGDLTLKNLAINTCATDVQGIVVQNDTGNTTLTNVTIGGLGKDIHSTNGGDGGCVNHGSGNLNITNSNFTNCVIDNFTSGSPPSTTPGNGGALSVGNVGTSTNASLTNVTFQNNTAGTSGGAIELTSTDAISIVNATFTNNTANGNTSNLGNAEIGGGAIFASDTANKGHVLPDVPSHFLILSTVFTLNTAPNGTGGAILVSVGNLSAATALPPPPWILPGPGPVPPGTNISIPGGVFDSQFFNNSAGGTPTGAPVDTRGGAGGAIFVDGNMDMLDSSLINNSSSNGSGGGIAEYGSSVASSISNATFNGNSAKVNGGAIANLRNAADSFNGTMTLNNDTISGNSAAANGGGAIYNGGAASDVVASNTILANSSAGGNCAPANGITDQIGNLQFGSGTDCGAAMKAGDPMLAGALLGGGPNFVVFVMKLNAGSAASRAGDNTTCTNPPVYNLDAALNTRPNPSGTPCDIGAYESNIVPDLTISSTHTDPFTANTGTYTLHVTNLASSSGDSTSGAVAFTETLPAGLNAVSWSAAAGWNCTLTPTLGCSRVAGDPPLASGSSYPDLMLTVSFSSTGSGNNVATIAPTADGGEVNTANDTATDPTTWQSTTPVTLQSFSVD